MWHVSFANRSCLDDIVHKGLTCRVMNLIGKYAHQEGFYINAIENPTKKRKAQELIPGGSLFRRDREVYDLVPWTPAPLCYGRPSCWLVRSGCSL